ncbi:MAG: hypothetical protein PHO66_04335 [Eubacteriales bacterium]|nr:hypothetical protein [Eubacteriales bacterium]
MIDLRYEQIFGESGGNDLKAFKTMLPYWLIIALGFYLLPLLIGDTGSAMAILLIALPLICLICALVYGAKHAFHWLFAVGIALLFVPSIFLFYNASAWVYSPGYGVVVAVGNLLGWLLGKVRA